MITILRNRRSRGARALADALSVVFGARNVSLAGANSVRKCTGDRYVINWGVSTHPANFDQRRLISSNSALAVSLCQNKSLTFDMLNGADVPHLEYCTRLFAREDVPLPVQWLEEDGKIVVRHTVTGHSGNGIEIFRRGGQDGNAVVIPNAPLYTRYFRKQAEYRVHVAFGNVILIQQKKRRNNAEQTNVQQLVRTHANGWVFATNDLSCDERNYRERLCALGIAAANAVGAGHCAVDILVNHDLEMQHQRLAATELGQNGQFDEIVLDDPSMVVCEINSAPGIEASSTLEAYTIAFVDWIEAA